jgi:WD40 repeat protein
VQFSKGERSRYLATLGYTDDSYVCVWDWANNALAPIAASSLVGSLSLSPLDDSCGSFVVCGKRHISIVSLPNSHTSDTVTIREAIIPTLDVRALSLGAYSDSTFIDVSSSNKHIYAVSTSGNLISASGGKIEKWVKLKSPYAFSLSATDGVVVCGCSDATLRIFEAGTLSYLGTLPRPYAIGSENLFIQTKKCSTARQKGESYADVICSRVSADSASVACVYSDRTIMFWDISDTKKPQVSSFLFSHNGSVWGIEALPTDFASSSNSAYPNATHVTSSADGSLRFWRASAGHPQFDCIGVLPVTQVFIDDIDFLAIFL